MTMAGGDGLELAAPPRSLDSEQLAWHQFMDSLPVGIYACDRSGRIVRFNDMAAQLWGSSPDVSAHHGFCGALKAFRLDGEPISPAESPMAELLATGRPVRGREFIIERPDGSRIYVEANLDPIIDGAGELIGGVNCFQDITSRKQGERELEQILGALPVAVYTTDADGRITFFNEAAVSLWGRRPELGAAQWCGSWRLRDMDGNALPHDQCLMAKAVQENREIRWGRAVAERPDGTLVPFVAFPTPLRNAAGVLIGAVNTLIDISDQQRAADVGMHMAAIVEILDGRHRQQGPQQHYHKLESRRRKAVRL